MKKFSLIYIACMILTYSFADNIVYETKSLNKNIKTVQIENFSRKPYYPIIELGGKDKVTLSFDDLSPEINTYSYSIIHCNADWTKSKLNEFQYLNGFDGGFIRNYESSVNTYFPYTHYTLTFPNEDVTCTISGNYIISVYPDNDKDNPVLTARFMVVESLVQINCTVSPITDISYKKDYQQMELSIDYPDYAINQPSTELKVIVQQNRRTDNQAVLTQPSFYEQHKINYKLNKNLIFEAGNEYREFDISSTRVISRQIESIAYFKPYYHATLYPDIIKSNKEYEYWQDIAGRYIINVQNSDYSETEGDYFFTHFSLAMEIPYLSGEIYILGDITGNRFDDNSRMQYNYQTGSYEKTLLLKQGGYDYMYAFVPFGEKKGSTKEIEGNKWETDNEYIVYVYHHPFGSIYDRLIGYQIVYSNQYKRE
ncbi:MAG: hypothetical protein BWY27_00437 [Bacteroidetes bacterium ADurb.Bin234]|nr:MAG: hypothetical protein BWY27_00437 [Bacteroidetes bacterium ADurb.Bin234]